MNSSTTAIPPVTQQTVFVCGSLHLDVVVRAPQLPRLDETVVGSNVDYVCGGKGGNQAVAVALNGASTAFAGCIGDDEFGSKLSSHLQKNKIDCTELQKVSGASGMSVAIVDSNGDYGAVIVSASNLNIDCAAINLPESTGLLVLQNEVPQSMNVELARQANSINIPIMLNAAPYRPITANYENLIDILVLNRVEAEQFFKIQFSSTADVVNALSNTVSTVDTIIVTLGADGLVYRDNNGQVHEKSSYTVTVNSTHGAGDMFCGALASRVINGKVSDKALDYAMAAAASYVSSTLEDRSALDEQAIQFLLNERPA